MDFKNLCQNIDVSSLRARIPSLPAMPAMPQIKLPKSLPKLRPRRIFSRSREDLRRSGKGSTKEQQLQQQQQSPFHQLSARPPIPPAEFVNHSPQRISTISSLMHQQQRGDSQRGTYRSAFSVDDDYPTPREFEVPGRLSRPISPIHTSINGVTNERDAEGGAVAKMSLTAKLQKGYKDITEFRLSHIFAKKTVMRRDVIQIDHYVERFNEDREREQAEQERRDRKIADNYRFNFKVSRQDTDNSKRSMSSDDSPKQEVNKRGKRVHEQSEDESGMEATPPPRKPGIASTRFARVRNPPLEQYISDESNNELDEDEELPLPRGGRQKQKILQSSPESAPKAPAENRSAKALSKLRSLGKRSEETPEKLGEKKRRAPLSPQQSEEKPELAAAAENDNPLSVLKQNIKRFSKSIRRTQETDSSAARNAAEDTEGEGTPKKETKQISRTEKLAARLRKFASHEASTENLDETASPKKSEEQRSPIRAAISNKLQTWKKSFKRKPNETDGVQTGEETSPEREGDKEKRTDNLMKKLRNMRQRNRASSTDDIDGTEDEASQTPTGKPKDANSRRAVNFEERFEQARKRTFKKVNEKMQQIKFFHKSQENIEKERGRTKKDAGKQSEQEYEDQSDDERTVYVRPHTAARRAVVRDTPSDSEEEQQPEGEELIEETKYAEREFGGTHIQHTRAIWTTKNLLTDSLDSETDTELPRVLIHQDNSDQFESTLIIAVTRPAPPVPPTTTIIEEIHDDPPMKPSRASRTPSPGSSRAEWIPNNEIISSFLEITPPSKRRLSSEAILPAPRGHARKMSIDSNSDSDSWIPESAYAKKLGQQSKEDSVESASAVTLNSIDEKEEPWKVQRTHCDEKLYKTKSIDLFEASVRRGGANAAFDDFEEELRDEPILKVPQQRHIDSSFEKDSSEEPFAADDDNSSRVTKILRGVIREESEEVQENVDERLEIQLPQVPERKFSNSSESLIANIDESEREKLNEKDDAESKDYADDEDDDDRPPSAAPSPPPSMSPPPPPLPLRKSVLVTSKTIEESAPLPTTKPSVPPIPPTKPSQPTRIPDRTPSMTRIAKPLVKTSSLRLAYNEQVNPSDVGKVNKLISRFETPQSRLTQRPRIIRRRPEEYSDDDDDDDLEEDEDEDGEQDMDAANANAKAERDATPTPTNTPRTYSLESETESLRAISTHATTTKPRTLNLEETTTTTIRSNVGNGNQTTKAYSEVPRITLNFDSNSNLSLSRASSEYGSPLEYPSSLIGSTETTPIPERRPQDLGALRNAERNRRSMTRDDDKFLSFDSDDENSYYSISSTGSSRYVVEI